MSASRPEGVFRRQAHSLMQAVHGCLTRLELVPARQLIGQIQELAKTAGNETERSMGEFALNYCCAFLADSLAMQGFLSEAAAVADSTWRNLEAARMRREREGAMRRNNSLAKATVIAAWSQIAWQQDNGTLSALFNVSQLCELYFALRAAAKEEVAGDSELNKARRKKIAPTLLVAGVCLAKAAYRHAPRHLRKLVRTLNENDGALLMLGKNHFKDFSHADTPWYYDFEICKGIVDQDLSQAEYDMLASLRRERWPLYGAAEFSRSLLLFWERERNLMLESSCSDAQKQHHPRQGVA